MSGLIDDLMGALGGARPDLGSLLGDGDTGRQQEATRLGVETILAGLARNAADPAGAQALFETLDRHDGSALDDPAARLTSAESAAEGQKILGHVFGGERDAVVSNLAGKTGLDAGSVAKLLPALAPIVLGLLGRKKSGGGLDVAGLAGMLKGESAGFDLGDILGMLGGGAGGSSNGGGKAGGLAGMLPGGAGAILEKLTGGRGADGSAGGKGAGGLAGVLGGATGALDKLRGGTAGGGGGGGSTSGSLAGMVGKMKGLLGRR